MSYPDIQNRSYQSQSRPSLAHKGGSRRRRCYFSWVFKILSEGIQPINRFLTYCSFEPQAFAAVSWNERAIHLHCQRKRKKKSGPTIKPEYRLELEKVTAQSVAKVVEEEFGPKLQRAGGKMVFGDNDKKIHSGVHLNSSRI